MGRIYQQASTVIPTRKAEPRAAKEREVPLQPQPPLGLAANGFWRRRTKRRRPRPAAATGGRPASGVPRWRLPPPLRGLLRSRPLPPRPIRCQPEEVRDAVWRLRREGNLRVQTLQGHHHDRVVSDVRPGVRQPMSMPYL